MNNLGLQDGYINAGKTDRILIKVLQEVCVHQHGEDSNIHFSQDFLGFEQIYFDPFHAFVEIIIVLDAVC